MDFQQNCFCSKKSIIENQTNKMLQKSKTMRTGFSTLIISCFFCIAVGINANAQNKIWSVDECIQFALEKNIQIQQAQVSNDIYGLDLSFAKSAWYPSL